MLKILPLFLAALASPAALHAREALFKGEVGAIVSRPAGAPVPRLAISLSDLPTPAHRLYSPPPSVDGEGRTAIDHRFAPDGLYGSVGFVCDNDNHPPAPQDSGVFAGSQAGRLIGGTLRYPF